MIPGTSYRIDKQIHFSNNQFTNGVLTWFNCNSSFRNLQIIRSDLRFCNTFQFVKYSAPKKFFSLLAVKNEVNELLPVNSLFICSCQIKVQQLPLAVFHHKKNHLKHFFRQHHLNMGILKTFFSLKSISRDNIHAKISSCLVNTAWLIT